MFKEQALYNELKDGQFTSLFSREQRKVEQIPNPNSEGVVVLSGHGIYGEDGKTPITWNSPGNQVRILHGVNTYLKIAQQKLGIEHPTRENLVSLASGDRPFFLYLNGEFHEPENPRNQLKDMFEILDVVEFPVELAVAQNCVIGGRFNTLTQFQAINEDPVLGSAKHITLVTSDYHAIRAAGTAEVNLSQHIAFDIAPAHQFAQEQDVFKTLSQIAGEIDRIVNYSSKTPPDVALVLTRGSIL